LAGVDILAHPGLIKLEDAKLAAERGVYLELTTRKGHSYTNGHVIRMAKETGAKLVLNNDFHSPENYVGEAFAIMVLMGAGMTMDEAQGVLKNGMELFKSKLS
jgi:histidinol phosphatase-like PHP family hydrolase